MFLKVKYCSVLKIQPVGSSPSKVGKDNFNWVWLRSNVVGLAGVIGCEFGEFWDVSGCTKGLNSLSEVLVVWVTRRA